MIKKFLKRGMAVTLAMSLIMGLTQTGFSPGRSSVKKVEAAALTFQVGEGSASKPPFNFANFPAFDKDTGNTEYYFGKYGNAFYGVGYGFTDSKTWELVDTDAQINGTTLNSMWGSSYDGQPLLNNISLCTNTFFSSADQKAMKSQSVAIDTYHWNNQTSTNATGSLTTKMWPLSARQLTLGNTYPDQTTYTLFNNLGRKLASNIGNEAWTRSYAGGGYAWEFYCYQLMGTRNMDSAYRVAPAFALDLEQVLLPRIASSGASKKTLSAVGSVSGNLKFLINAGTTKSNFTVPAISGKTLINIYNGKTYEFDYSGASTSQLSSGADYISAIIYDSTGKAVYYGNLGTVDEETGTARITIPSDLTIGNTYTLALFQEEKCISKFTDYASTPVYATFTAQNKFNLSYDVATNGGTSTTPSSVTDIEPDTVFDDASGVFDKTAEKQGWTFVGWNTNKDAHEGLTSLTMESDKTLYAIFKKDLTVTFIDAGS